MGHSNLYTVKFLTCNGAHGRECQHIAGNKLWEVKKLKNDVK